MLSASERVRVHSLAARADLNGCAATLVDWVEETGRWNAVVDDINGAQLRLALKPANLIRMDALPDHRMHGPSEGERTIDAEHRRSAMTSREAGDPLSNGPSSSAVTPSYADVQGWQDYGRALGLTISRDGHHPPEERDGVATEGDRYREEMVTKGYARHGKWCPHANNAPMGDANVRCLARSIDALQQAGLPAQLLLLFDQAWDCIHTLCAHLGPIYGTRLLHDFHVANVPPGGRGWSIRRDRECAGANASFDTNGLPLYITVCLGLTDASPEASCVYALPAKADPGYRSTVDVSDDVTASARSSTQCDIAGQPTSLIFWGLKPGLIFFSFCIGASMQT